MRDKLKKYFFPLFLTLLLFTVLGFEIYLLRLPPEQIPTRFIIVFTFRYKYNRYYYSGILCYKKHFQAIS
jgi:hypothetical protein